MPMLRRQFLRILVASVGAAVTSAACGDDDGKKNSATDSGNDADAGSDAGFDASPDAGADAADDTGTPDADETDTADTTDATVEPPIQDGTAWFPQSVASGDPRPNSVVLWTRVHHDELDGDASLLLQVARDEAFTELLTVGGAAALPIVAAADHDRCVKVRLTDLDPDTTYWFRFLHEHDGVRWASRPGRTRTAPLDSADRPVRFAFVSCQDITGVYYNPYKRLVTEDLDFFVHLGDYVYETDGDPGFQVADPNRKVSFRDLDGAILLGEGDDTYRAAASLDNYRDLYRTYRADPWLQAMHERFPMIAIWDDHEFSNDCWGANATYHRGEQDEFDVERRKNANQAWFEFMPVEYRGDPDFSYDRDADFPGDLHIWRDLRWGAHLHLVATDLRTWRPDHVIGEDEHPAAIAVTEDALLAHHGGVPDFATPYLDLDDDSVAAGHIRQWADDNDYPVARLPRFFGVPQYNAIRTEQGGEGLDAAAIDALPRGITLESAGKRSLFSSLGSRSLATVGAHDLVSAERFRTSDGASENLMGTTQRSWFLDTMLGSTARWKVWCNEFCLLPKIVDVTDFDRLPDSLRQKFYLSVEDWGGAMNERDNLIDQLQDAENVVAITGDIHAFFASTPAMRSDPDRRIAEFVTSSISSGTYERLLINTANSDPGLAASGAAAVALIVKDLLTDPVKRSNPELCHANIKEHGFTVVELDDETFRVRMVGYPQNLARQDLPVETARADSTVSRVAFHLRAGRKDILRDLDGTEQFWDRDTMTWKNV